MHDYKIIGRRTPLVFAEKKNDAIAVVNSSLPCIYHKNFDITEFIGEELATIRGVNSNHYVPVCFGKRTSEFNRSNLRVGSFDFMKKGYSYSIAPSLPLNTSESFDALLELCPNDKNREDFINENLEMIGLDIYMSQWDRGGNTIYEFCPNGEIHLAPVHDYEESLDVYCCNQMSYVSDFFQLLSIDDYQEMMIKYPKLREILSSYLGVDLISYIYKMAKSRRFLVSEIDMDDYKRYSDAAQKKLEKILR